MTDDASMTAKVFRALSLGELLDEWDEPMPAEARAVLLAELETRGYRMNALTDPPEPGFAAPISGADRLERLRKKRVHLGSMLVLLIGALTLVGAVIASFQGDDEYRAHEAALAEYAEDDILAVDGEELTAGELRLALKAERAFVLYIPYAMAGLFLALYVWSRSSPKVALLLASLLYVALEGMDIAAREDLRPVRILWGVLVVGAFATSVRAAWKAPEPEEADVDKFWEGV